jgi:hypothetical protein
VDEELNKLAAHLLLPLLFASLLPLVCVPQPGLEPKTAPETLLLLSTSFKMLLLLLLSLLIRTHFICKSSPAGRWGS